MREVAYSSALAGFICHGVNHGSHARITIEIDGTACEISILAAADEPLMEYLAQWACAQKLRKHIRLQEFDKQGREEAANLAAIGKNGEIPIWKLEG